MGTRFLACVLVLAGIGSASIALGQQPTDTLVTINHNGFSIAGSPIPPGTFIQCRGTPTCVSEFQNTFSVASCPGTYTVHVRSTVSGLNLSATSLQGTIVQQVAIPGGCTTINNIDYTYTYTGTWNPSTRTGSITMVGPSCSVGGVDTCASFSTTIQGSITAGSVPPPVFPMTVTANITPTIANATAQIQFRPQDVGTSGSVFVFAVAPAARVQGVRDDTVRVGLARDGIKAFEKADACVISQLTPSGTLVAVSGQQMQALLSGTLSAAGTSVNILNNVSTPNVAGATFYVGYGTNAQRMLNDGIFRNAVLVPGSSVCPMLPTQTALWWNPEESGWGVNLNHQGSTMFGTLFTYDQNRAPLWLVMSGGTLQADGVTYTGDLYRTTGPAFNAQPFTPIGASNIARVGSMSVRFADANLGTLTYSMNGVQVEKTIQRQVYGSRAANCLPGADNRAASTNYQDLWWNPAESGWGINVTHQDNTLFATLFTYDSNGRDLWLVMSNGARQGDGSYTGELYRTSGPAFNTVPFTGVSATSVGTMRLRFTDGNNGTLTYTFNGATVTKAIQRQVFSSPVSTCQ